jgi:hypothetical protein
MTPCLLFGLAQAQTSISTTNRPTVGEAVKVASGLQFRMKESDADEYLVHHGFTCDTNRTFVYLFLAPTNSSLTITMYYPLKGNCRLSLGYYHAETPDTGTNTDTRWERDGILAEAEIESNRVDIISITLTNSK